MSATSMKYYQVRHIEIQLDQVYWFATGALAGVIHLRLAERYRVRGSRVRGGGSGVAGQRLTGQGLAGQGLGMRRC